MILPWSDFLRHSEKYVEVWGSILTPNRIICTRIGHKASAASRRRSSRSLLWTAGKAYTPAVVPVSCLPDACQLFACCLPVVCLVLVWCLSVCCLFVCCLSVCCLSGVCLLPLYTLSTSLTRFLVYISGTDFDVSTWITINKSAYFLIVTIQKPCFTRI